MMVMTFWGNERFREKHVEHHDEHAHDARSHASRRA